MLELSWAALVVKVASDHWVVCWVGGMVFKMWKFCASAKTLRTYMYNTPSGNSEMNCLLEINLFELSAAHVYTVSICSSCWLKFNNTFRIFYHKKCVIKFLNQTHCTISWSEFVTWILSAVCLYLAWNFHTFHNDHPLVCSVGNFHHDWCFTLISGYCCKHLYQHQSKGNL
jgi:hypothetical protein